MAEKRDPSIAALEAVYAALKDIDPAERKKVLSSAFALLGVESVPALSQVPQQGVRIGPPEAANFVERAGGEQHWRNSGRL